MPLNSARQNARAKESLGSRPLGRKGMGKERALQPCVDAETAITIGDYWIWRHFVVCAVPPSVYQFHISYHYII